MKKVIYFIFTFSILISACKKVKLEPKQQTPTGTPLQILDAQTHLPVNGATITFYGGTFGSTHIYTTNIDGYIFIDNFHYESVKFEKTGYLTDWRDTVVAYMDMQKPIYLNIHVKDVAFYMGDNVSLNYRPLFANTWILDEWFSTGTDINIIREGDLRAGYIIADILSKVNIPFTGAAGDTVNIDCFY